LSLAAKEGQREWGGYEGEKVGTPRPRRNKPKREKRLNRRQRRSRRFSSLGAMSNSPHVRTRKFCFPVAASSLRSFRWVAPTGAAQSIYPLRKRYRAGALW